jgi:hypothetical protein
MTRSFFAVLLLSLVICSCGASAELNEQATGSAKPAGNTQSTPSTKEPRRAGDPTKFAVIIAGVGGEEEYTKKFTAQAMKLYDVVTAQLGFDEKQVYLLTENVAGGPEDGTRANLARATSEEVRKAFARIKESVSQDGLVLVTLIGHGSSDNQQPKFNLVGPDLTAKDYAELLRGLPTRRVVFVNCGSSSGDFVKPLSAEGHVVITATRSGNEQNATIFADHFISGLTEAAADSDKNGRVSMLEVFNYASKLTSDWYKQKERLATEHALIEDNGDGVGHEQPTDGDGGLAKATYLDSKPLEIAGSDAELGRLLLERQRLEEAVEKLKAKKSEMKEDVYTAELEKLLVDLAKLNQAIKAKPKQ